MTIGPDPITRMCLMSSRLGIEQLHKAVEEIRGIVRTGRGFWVVLNAECLGISGNQALNDVVVEADMAHFDGAEVGLRRPVERRVDCEAVVVRGDLDLARGA